MEGEVVFTVIDEDGVEKEIKVIKDSHPLKRVKVSLAKIKKIHVKDTAVLKQHLFV